MKVKNLKLRDILSSEKFLYSAREAFERFYASEADIQSVIKATIPGSLMNMTILPEHFKRKFDFFGYFFEKIFEDIALPVFGPDLYTRGGLEYSGAVQDKMAAMLSAKHNNEEIEKKRHQLIFFLHLHEIIPLCPVKKLREKNINLH